MTSPKPPAWPAWTPANASRGLEERIRSGLPCQLQTINFMAIDSDIKERAQADGLDDLGAMMARGHDGHFQSHGSCQM
jgi:hypothetical protein